MLRGDGQSYRSTEETLECWRPHCQNTLNHPPVTQCQSLDSDAARAVPDPAISDDAPMLGEVRRAIRKLRNGRAARSDGIQPELLKYAEEPVSTSLHSLFAQVWKSGLVPAEWREGIIVSLYKRKGLRNKCGSYRPISLLSVPGKMFANVLLARLHAATTNSTSSTTAVWLYSWPIHYRCHPSSPSSVRATSGILPTSDRRLLKH